MNGHEVLPFTDQERIQPVFPLTRLSLDPSVGNAWSAGLSTPAGIVAETFGVGVLPGCEGIPKETL